MKKHGIYHLNPPGKKKKRKTPRTRKAAKRRARARKLRNPIPYGVVVVNPVGKRRSARSSSKRRRRNATRRRIGKKTSPANTAHKNVSSPNMKKSRRGRRRHRNASRRRSRRRSTSVALRNPVRRHRRSRSRRMRNPVSGVVGDIFNSDTLTLGAGVVVGTTGPTIVVNKLRASQMAVNGSLPGLNPANPSPMAIMLYKLVIGAGVGYLLRNQSPRFARGMIIGAVSGAMSDLLMQSRVLQSIPGAGVSRILPASRPGAGAYVPGISTRFTGPSSNYLAAGRNGVGARVGPGTVNTLPGMVAPAFGN